jgi:hypothetical protein
VLHLVQIMLDDRRLEETLHSYWLSLDGLNFVRRNIIKKIAGLHMKQCRHYHVKNHVKKTI